MQPIDIAVVGSGINGVTAALELAARGHRVTLLDPGPLPHPLAASTDISKVVRIEYGADEDYMALGELALAGWRAWNEEFGMELFHETGVMFLRQSELRRGGFEYESFRLLNQRGHMPQRLTSSEIKKRFPAWNSKRFVDGFFDPEGGFAESGRVVMQLVQKAQLVGVKLREGKTFARLTESGGKVRGVETAEGTKFPADVVLFAAGAWTHHLLPHLAGYFRSVGMPVFHLQPKNPELFRSTVFPVFGADTSTTGYYGFPLNRDGVVKIARHTVGREMHPEAPERVVNDAEEEHFRGFLSRAFPSLADAPIVYRRICLYSDTHDAHFWIAPDPEHKGLVVAAGDSGHGFKFAPVLGSIIADAVEGKANPWLPKFRWRPEIKPTRKEEAARHQGDE